MMLSDLYITHKKISDFVLFPLFEFTLVTRMRNFDFRSHCNTLFFLSKKMMLDLNMSCQILFNLVLDSCWQYLEKYKF